MWTRRSSCVIGAAWTGECFYGSAPPPHTHPCARSESKHSLEEFIREHDAFYYGPQDRGQDTPSVQPVKLGRKTRSPFRSLSNLAGVQVMNSFETISGLHEHLAELNLLDPERLRPDWDTYFMQLASLSSRRSNCMKRRVGAVLVRNKRVLATGYVPTSSVSVSQY